MESIIKNDDISRQLILINIEMAVPIQGHVLTFFKKH